MDVSLDMCDSQVGSFGNGVESVLMVKILDDKNLRWPATYTYRAGSSSPRQNKHIEGREVLNS